MRVLVTGASGFIGGLLSRNLAGRGCPVRGLDLASTCSSCSDYWQVDLTVTGDWSRQFEGIDHVFHLAGKVHSLAETKQDEAEYFRINTEGTRNVLEAARQAGVKRFVLFSTIKAMSRDGAGGSGQRTVDRGQWTAGKGQRAESAEIELSTSNIQHSTLNSERSKKPAAGDRRQTAEDQRSVVSGQGADVTALRAFNEEDFIEPDTPYGQSKLEAEKLVLHGGYVPEPVVLRLCMVYGPGAKGNMQKMLQAVAKNRFPPLPEVKNKRSMVHVQDVVTAAMLAAERPEAVGQTFIVSDGYPYSTRQIYDLMCQELGRRPPKWSIPIPCLRALGLAGDAIGKLRGKRFMFDSDALEKLLGSAWFSSNKIETLLGFKPEWNLEKALPEMVAEMKKAEIWKAES